MRRPSTLPAVAVLATLLLAGCGTASEPSEDFEGEERAVAQVVEDLEEAATEDEPRRACQALLAPALVQRLGERCTQAVQQAFDEKDSAVLETRSVRVTGTTARAQVNTGRDEDEIELIEFVRQGDDWRIARFAGPVR